jgi:hypothetical protein
VQPHYRHALHAEPSTSKRSIVTLALVLASACAGTTSVRPPGRAESPAVPTPDEQLAAAVTRALKGGRTDDAAAVIERARHLPAAAQPRAEVLAYYDATVHAYRDDYQGAAEVLHDYTVKVGPTARAAFDFHDAMIALRTADGDLLGALVECDEMVLAGLSGTWTSPDVDRVTQVRLKEYWHRAYLLRMIAQQRTGREREALVEYAERARKAYRELATPISGMGDSIAVLDAYFAYCDGSRDAMRAAAQRVDTAEDDDVEDLYLVQIALDGAGDSDAAAALRARIVASAPTIVLTPVFMRWMREDAATEPPEHRFSPKFPTGHASGN